MEEHSWNQKEVYFIIWKYLFFIRNLNLIIYLLFVMNNYLIFLRNKLEIALKGGKNKNGNTNYK